MTMYKNILDDAEYKEVIERPHLKCLAAVKYRKRASVYIEALYQTVSTPCRYAIFRLKTNLFHKSKSTFSIATKKEAEAYISRLRRDPSDLAVKVF